MWNVQNWYSQGDRNQISRGQGRKQWQPTEDSAFFAEDENVLEGDKLMIAHCD